MNKIVLFYSNGCEPCNALRPVLETMLEEKEIHLEQICVDTPAGAKHAEKHAVTGWPMVYAIQDDIIVAEMMGADPNGTAEQHKERIEKELLTKL